MEHQFASCHWQKRWNGARGPVAAITDMGAGADGLSKDIKGVNGPFGVVFIEREDIPHLIKHTEAMLDLLRKELS